VPPLVLATKYFVPRLRAGAVSRPRLLERLDEGFSGDSKLFLVSAPAGFGKTSLLGEWAARGPGGMPGCGVAWLSLDAADGDPARFLLYVAASIHEAEPSCGSDAMAALQAARQPAAEEILSDLINDIDGSLRDILLVLDDYHATDSPGVDAALAFLLERSPPGLRVAVATREDPSLPLARLRARGELTELRAADLRFTAAEAADFLGRSMGLRLSEEQASALGERTEGWVAGLQLAALSLRDQEDVAGFIASFTGSHRFVLDYLAEEVLLRESAGVQDFLARCSVLDRFCGPLCDALAGDAGRGAGAGGQEVLEYLERANLFVVPLDEERRWFRFHRLFAELLRRRLDRGGAAGGDRARELQIRASAWFEEQGLPVEAFKYAAAAGDLDRCSRLVASGVLPLYFRGAVIPVIEWIESLPKEILDARPTLRVLFSRLSLIVGRMAGVEESLAAAELSLEAAEPAEGRRGLLGHIAAARATLAVARYRAEEVEDQARRALELLEPQDLPLRLTATWAMAMALQFKGDRAAAGSAFAGLEALSRPAGNAFFTQLALSGLGELREKDNRLREAAATYREVIRSFGAQILPNAGEAHLGLARVLYEWNDLDAAEDEAETGLRLVRLYDSAVDRFILSELHMARIKLAKGLVEAASSRLEALTAAAAAPHFRHRLPEIDELRAFALLRAGDIAAAEALAGNAEHPMILARVRLAKGEARAAASLLESLRSEAAARGWLDSELRVQAPLTIALEACGRGGEALRLLAGMLEKSEAESFIRLFLDEGEPMKNLIARGASLGALPSYGDKILAAFAAERAAERAPRWPSAAESSGRPAPSERPARTLLDPLSERELEVLRLLAEGLSNQEIGERLFLALDTIKGHNRRIFDKLDAARRGEAVARARELGLLP
jgi:LuxR family transcriptional regulator, maltose regulon positive regulatory protein